jgi:lysozyme
MMQGIDVSHWNGVLDWTAIKKYGIDFAYIKATESTTLKDHMFEQHVNGAKAAGVPWGPYHFFRYVADAKAQAAEFYNTVSAVGTPDLPPVLDLEDKSAPKSTALVAKMKETLVEIERLFKVKPIIYTGTWWWNPYTNYNKTFGSWPLWIAAYTYYYPAHPTLPAGWSSYLIHQYTNQLNIPGSGDPTIDGNYAPSPLFGKMLEQKVEALWNAHLELH